MAIPTNRLVDKRQFAQPAGTLAVSPPVEVPTVASNNNVTIDGQPHIDKRQPGKLGHNRGY